MGRNSKKRSAKKSAQLPEHLPFKNTEAIADQLMTRWYARLIEQWRRLTGASSTGPLSSDELERIAQGVARLSKGLTRQRELIHQTYMDDPQLLGAYLLFYWPISYMQTRHVLRHVTWPVRSAVDFGAGPGPGVAALYDFGVQTLTALDHASEALSLARAFLPFELTTSTMNLASQTWQGEADLLLACHALNEWMRTDEMTAQVATRLHEQAHMSHASTMVLIEPALQDTSRRLLMVRDHLLEKGWCVRAPCLHQGHCPALHHEQDWCHATIQWRPPSPIEKIAQRASIHKSRLKMTFLVLRQQDTEQWSDASFRIVSEPLHTKGRYHYIGCGPAGRVGLTMLARHDNEVSRRFQMLRRYDVITLSEPERRGDGLRLDPQAPLDVVQSPFMLDE